MQIDGNTLPDGAHLDADVAVVGAGAAGIVVALELARSGLDVILVESGGSRYDPRLQRLGDLAGADAYQAPMNMATRRQIGGATNLWGGRCVPFDRVDFERRDTDKDRRWPVRYDELTPYFARACEWCKCGDPVFDAREVPELRDRELVAGLPNGEVLTTSLERWSLPTNFGREYGQALRGEPTLRLVTGLTCVEILCEDAGQRVAHLRLVSPVMKTVRVRARRYVLACGGLETTRLLLACSARHPEGIGNHSDHLGRWYMAHVESRVARANLTPASPGAVIYGHERDGDGVYVRRRFSFDPEVLQEQGMANAVLWLVNPELGDPRHGSGVLSFVYLMLISPLGRFFVAEAIRQSHIKTTHPATIRAHARNVVRNLWPATRFAFTFAYQRYLKRGRKVPGFFVASAADSYPLLYHGEHLPHHDSRVTLSAETDELGMPRLVTDMRFSEKDVTDVVAAHDLLDRHLRRHGRGHVEYLYDDPAAAARAQLFGGYHQAGTTRMSADPADGVVDANLAVHGFDELFVASSSTFPSSGQANSTFLLVAFGLRLADRLVDELSAVR